MANKKFIVKLSGEERKRLSQLTSKGKAKAKTILKARILLKADQGEWGEGWADELNPIRVGRSRVRTRSVPPQSNLASAYLSRVRGARSDNQEKAIEHLQAALTVFIREAFPQPWIASWLMSAPARKSYATSRSFSGFASPRTRLP
jgi:hypothetical protein